MLEREWLLGVARAEREALGRTVQYTPPDRWEADSPSEGWRVKDVLAHVAASDVAAAAAVAAEAMAEVDEFVKSLKGEPFTVDGWNRWSADRRRETPVVQTAVEWGRAADLLLTRISRSSDEEWREREIPWLAGDIKLGYFLQARVAEWWVHGEDILEGGGLPPRLEHPPIYCVNDFAIRLIPYALSLEGLRYPGKSAVIELEGVGEGRWHQGLEAGFVPPEDKQPDVIIHGRGYAFASVAGGRADPYVALYEGLVNFGGEPDPADAVLRTLRSFP